LDLDIIIPVYNEEANLKKLLPFLKLHLSNTNSNVIVVDSCNSDDNAEQVCNENNATYLCVDQAQRAAQLNAGARHGTGKNLLFLHADVVPPDDFYTSITSCLEANDCGMFAYRFDRRTPLLEINAFFTQFDGPYAGGGDQCFFITRSAFQKLNGFDESYGVMEDFEFFSRVKNSNLKYKILKKKAIVSARKYKKHNYFKINWVNLRMLIAFYLKQSPQRLMEKYNAMDINS
jgi:rSAM/selenodomain-associated transferase 2